MKEITSSATELHWWKSTGCSRTLEMSWAILQKTRKVTKGGKEVIEQIQSWLVFLLFNCLVLQYVHLKQLASYSINLKGMWEIYIWDMLGT